jgi:hypothetical protein
MGANAEGKSAEDQKSAADTQAKYADLSALDALQRGEQEAARYRAAGSQTIAKQRVAFAANNIELSAGTPLDVIASTRGLSELDALTVKNNAAREAWGFRRDADSLRATGQFARQSGQNKATGTLLTGAAQGVGTIAGAAADYLRSRKGSS